MSKRSRSEEEENPRPLKRANVSLTPLIVPPLGWSIIDELPLEIIEEIAIKDEEAYYFFAKHYKRYQGPFHYNFMGENYETEVPGVWAWRPHPQEPNPSQVWFNTPDKHYERLEKIFHYRVYYLRFTFAPFRLFMCRPEEPGGKFVQRTYRYLKYGVDIHHD